MRFNIVAIAVGMVVALAGCGEPSAPPPAGSVTPASAGPVAADKKAADNASITAKESDMPDADTPADNLQEPRKSMEQVIADQTTILLAIPGIVGLGETLCDGKPCLQVMVKKLTPDLQAKIPKSIDGYPVTIRETGVIKAF